MKIKIDASMFREAMNAVSGLVDEITIQVTNEDMNILCMDPANVAMVSFNMPSSSAIEWECTTTEEEPVEKVCIKLTDLNTILRRTSKDDILNIETIDNQLQIGISGYKDFTIPLIAEEESKEQKMPPLEHKAKVKMPTKKILDAIEDCSIADEGVIFSVSKDKLVLSAQGDMKKAAITLEGEDVHIESEADQKVKFAIEYLRKMVLPKTATTVEVCLNTDYPLMLKYTAKGYKMEFLLAPRVENN